MSGNADPGVPHSPTLGDFVALCVDEVNVLEPIGGGVGEGLVQVGLSETRRLLGLVLSIDHGPGDVVHPPDQVGSNVDRPTIVKRERILGLARPAHPTEGGPECCRHEVLENLEEVDQEAIDPDVTRSLFQRSIGQNDRSQAQRVVTGTVQRPVEFAHGFTIRGGR